MKVLIVGAGPSGLVTAYHLQRMGIACEVLERGPSPGTTFGAIRSTMSLVSPPFFSELPGLAFPAGSPEFLPMPAFRDYLVAFASQHRLPVRIGVEVASAERTADGFRVALASGEVLAAPHLVACTGVYANPHVPRDLGLEAATVPWVHANGYRGPAPYRGRKTLVVGNGISAQEIALELAAAETVTMAGRRPFRVVPNPVLGVDLHWLAWLPEMVPVKWARWAVRRAQEPLSGAAIAHALSTHRVLPRPGVSRVEGDLVTFADGTSERFEALIFATGFRPHVAWLGELAGSTAAERERLSGVVDCAMPGVPGLWFVGFPFIRTFASRYVRGIRRDAEFVARSIARALHERP